MCVRELAYFFLPTLMLRDQWRRNLMQFTDLYDKFQNSRKT